MLSLTDQGGLDSFLIIAHRGDSDSAPENTTSAFNLALLNGFSHFETDCQLTKDGTVVILHDENLGRTNDGVGCAWDYTIDELKRLDAGSWFSKKYASVRIPTLEDVLDRYSKKAHIHLVRVNSLALRRTLVPSSPQSQQQLLGKQVKQSHLSLKCPAACTAYCMTMFAGSQVDKCPPSSCCPFVNSLGDVLPRSLSMTPKCITFCQLYCYVLS